MEDALVLVGNDLTVQRSSVLILVLMEDALVRKVLGDGAT